MNINVTSRPSLRHRLLTTNNKYMERILKWIDNDFIFCISRWVNYTVFATPTRNDSRSTLDSGQRARDCIIDVRDANILRQALLNNYAQRIRYEQMIKSASVYCNYLSIRMPFYPRIIYSFAVTTMSLSIQ